MWKIESKKSIGPFCLEDKISNVRKLFGNEYEIFKRVPDDEDTIFAYDQYNIHITCGLDMKVKVISIFRPNEVEYRSIQLIGKQIYNVKEELRENGITLIEEDAGLWIEVAGILLIDINGIVDGIELYSE